MPNLHIRFIIVACCHPEIKQNQESGRQNMKLSPVAGDTDIYPLLLIRSFGDDTQVSGARLERSGRSEPCERRPRSRVEKCATEFIPYCRGPARGAAGAPN